ncbi:hypothetical protein EDB83DRAFT_907564 [Lactarius deliciosus]|nr:hypothetical protein EDB83DRAFT_907564 [Lactarius deliciosus]
MSNSSALPPIVVALLPLAIKEQPVIDAERYISAVGFTVLVYDLLLTFGDEVRYIWRRPVTNIKVLYLFLRCVGSLIVLALVGSMSIVLANYIMIIRVYTLWDHRKWMLRTLYIGYSLSVCSTIAFVATSIVQLAPHVIHDPFIFHMCLITGRTPYWIGIWLSQALFDVFLFVLTITNAASRPRRANVKIITDLRRDGLVFYLGLFVGRFLNVALSIPTDRQYYLIAVSFVLSLSTVTVTRLVLRVERLLVTRGSGRDLQVPNWMYNSYELQTAD